MYSQKDMQEARRSLNRCRGLLALVLAPLSVVYVLEIIKGRQGLMLAALLVGFGYAVFICDMKLLPALRYVRFLREMGQGLRRTADCVLDHLSDEVQLQDGVRVHALHVRLKEGGDSRIFYVNASKIALLPSMGAAVRITAYGRHVVDFEVLR